METPLLSHITDIDYLTVYEPAEDSFLMLDALEAEMAAIRDMNPAVCLEVGPGSGINVTAFGNVFRSCFCYAVDINPKACEITVATGNKNETVVECFCGDLVDSVRGNSVDVVLFNPPYVVTESLEVNETRISSAWAGGVRGREVIDRFLPMLPGILAENGVCYMVVIEENRPKEIAKIMDEMNFTTTTVVERRAWNERLKVLKFTRNKAPKA